MNLVSRILIVVLSLSAGACSIPQSGAFKNAYVAIVARNYNLALARLAVVEKYPELSEKQKVDIAYLKARSHEGLGKVAEAILIYQSINVTFPKSPYGYLAREKLRHLTGIQQASDEPLKSVNTADVSAAPESFGAMPITTIATRDNPAFHNYLGDVKKRIDSFWSYPCVKTAENGDCDFKDAETIVEIYVARDGNLSSITILEKSSVPIYEFHAIEAITLAAPFGVMSADMNPDASSVRLRIHFNYVDNRMHSAP